MQLTPATAVLISGDARLATKGKRLRDPAVNLRLGQDYLGKLLVNTDGDMLRAVASYNCGPGVMLKTRAALGQDADSLLVVESMPGAQTREYVQRVMSSYWIYRSLMGGDSRTLDAIASGAKSVPVALDAPTPRFAPSGRPTVIATANLRAGG